VLDAVRLTRDPRAQDVRVVAVRHGCESAGALDPGLREVVAVEAEADHRRTCEFRAQAAEGSDVLVDHRHGVLALLERARELAADPTASDDNDVQDRPPIGSSDGGCYGVAGRPRETGYVVRAARNGMLAATTPSVDGTTVLDSFKRVLVGRPLATSEQEHQRITKTIALAV